MQKKEVTLTEDLMNRTYNYKKGFSAVAVVYTIWGFQPLYFSLDAQIDTAFLLAARIIWAAVSCLLILMIEGKAAEVLTVFRDRKILKRELPAAVFLFADWALYLYGIRTGRVQECAMGYYIMPLVMIMFGVLIFREKIRWQHLLSLGFIIIGIVLSMKGFGGFPYLTVILALCFSVYSAIKKGLDVEPLVGTAAESLIMAPFAVLYILLFRTGADGLSGLTFSRQLFLIGSGLVTAVPMVFFARVLSYLPLSLTGILQYVSPTLGIVCSLILGEVLTREKLVSFSFIWVGIIIYSIFELKTSKSGS